MLPRMFLWCSLSLVQPLLLPCAQAQGPCRNAKQVCVSAVQTAFQGSAPSAVSVTRFGMTKPEAARPGMLLDPGDTLESEGPGAVAELSCPLSASLNFSGTFRAVVVAPQGRDCAVNLLSGSLDVLTADPTQAQAGDVTMGSKHTMYGLQVVASGGRSAAEAAVYDGEVDVFRADPSKPLMLTLAAGRKLAPAMREAAPLQTVDLDRPATVWARLDLAKAQFAGAAVGDGAATYSRLRATYAKVLAKPADTDARIELAGQQIGLASPRSALLQLQRAETLQLQPAQAAVLYVTKAAALDRLGDRQQAEQSYVKALNLDPDIRGKVDPFLIEPFHAPAQPGTMTVRASAGPSTVAPGSPTRILVQVLSQMNAPVAGAAVTLSAGGGRFAGSGTTRVSGSTDANGQFITDWSCSPCASRYVLDVEARKPASPPAAAQVAVAVQ